jgi:hypothetical protein
MSVFKEMTADIVKKSEAAGGGSAPAGSKPAPGAVPGTAAEAPKHSIWATIKGMFGHG